MEVCAAAMGRPGYRGGAARFWFDSDVQKGKGGKGSDSEKTTIMFGNLPKNKAFTAGHLLKLLEGKGFDAGKKIDFFYMPVDFRTYRNEGFAFVNFRDREDALKCAQLFDRFRDWPVSGQEKSCWTVDAFVQGKNANISRWKKSSVPDMRIQDNFKPMFFDEEGKRIPLEEALRADTGWRESGHSWSSRSWNQYDDDWQIPLEEATWADTDWRERGHSCYSWSWSQYDDGDDDWQEREHDDWSGRSPPDDDDWSDWHDGHWHRHGWNEGPRRRRQRRGKGKSVEAWQCQEGVAGDAVVSAGAAKPTSVFEAVWDLAHKSVPVESFDDFYKAKARLPTQAPMVQEPSPPSVSGPAGAAEPTSVSEAVGARAPKSVRVESFDDFDEARLAKKLWIQAPMVQKPEPPPEPSPPSVSGPAARYRYACPVCERAFCKWTACQHHLNTYLECKRLVFDLVKDSGKAELQDFCREKAICHIRYQ